MPEAPSPRDLLSAGTNEGIQEARAKATREAEIVLKTARRKNQEITEPDRPRR